MKIETLKHIPLKPFCDLSIYAIFPRHFKFATVLCRNKFKIEQGLHLQQLESLHTTDEKSNPDIISFI